mgnify:CR=1 FL=1
MAVAEGQVGGADGLAGVLQAHQGQAGREGVVGEAPVMEAQLITCTAEGTYNTVNLFETVIPALDGVGAKDNFTF